MDPLTSTSIMIGGRYRKKILELFGAVNVSQETKEYLAGRRMTFTADMVLPNFYSCGQATIENAPLFILIPDQELAGVWPGRSFDEIKLGTATKQPGGTTLTKGVGIFKGKTGLYICLSPVENPDDLEIGSLGM